MTDAIRTNTYTSTQNISTQDAVKYESQLEADTLAKIDAGALADVAIKGINSGNISQADAEKLLEMGKGLTSQDIDALVPGTLNRQAADALLLATSLGAYSEGTTTAADVASAMTKFYSMDKADQEATLNAFANQGSFERNLNVQMNADGTFASASYELTVNGEKLGPGDLPSTPESQRAAMFLMSDKGDATEPGAIKAFINWDFATANDQMSAMLGTLPNYENLSPTQQDAMSNYLAAAGRVAAGNVNAGQVDAADAEKAEKNIQKYDDDLSDMQAVIDAIEVADTKGNVHLKDLKYVGADGETHDVKDWLDKHKQMKFANKDGDWILGDKETKSFLETLEQRKDTIAEKKEIAEMTLNGASQDEIDSMKDNMHQQIEARRAMAALRAYDSDWKTDGKGSGGWLEQTKLKLNDVTFKDTDGKEVKLGDWLKENNIAFNDENNAAGMSWLHSDHDMTLGHEEAQILIENLNGYVKGKDNEAELIRAGHKSDWPGASGLSDTMEQNYKDQETMRNALSVLNQYNQDAGLVHLDKAFFHDADGNQMTLLEFFDKQGIDFPNKDKDNTLGNKESAAQEDVLRDALKKLEDTGDGLAKQMHDLQPPAQPTTPQTGRTTDGGNNAPVLGAGDPVAGGGSDPTLREVLGANTMSQDDLNALLDKPVSEMTTEEKQALINETGYDISQTLGDKTLRQVLDDKASTWDPNVKHGFDEAVKQLDNGNCMGPDAFASLGFSEDQTVDIGMLMFIIQSERISVLGKQIQTIIASQRKNTNDQKDMNAAMAALNTGGDLVDLKATTFTKSDGSTQSLADFMDEKGIKYDNDDGDYKLGKEEIQTAISNIKGSAEGLSNEGQMIMNELTQLSQKYQQAESLAMNFLEKFDAMKQKIIDKIRAG